MPDRLPPLTALRAFEAAARHLSFAAAADELSVTPAALSLQIKNLEEHLGAPLFLRLNRAVELTEAGRALQGPATEGFDALRRGWRATRRLQDDAKLIVTAGPAFTAKWLAPRLFGFAQAHPEIDLRFAATLKILDFQRDEVDVAIRFSDHPDQGLFSEVIYEGWISPMMRPDIAAQVKDPEDLLQLPLIHDDSLQFLKRVPDWAEWFRQAGVEAPEIKGLHFSQADHAVDLALEGGGVVLARSSMGAASLHTGALVAPFELSLTVNAQFRLVCPHGAEARPAIAAFRDWLHAEAAKDRPLAAGRRLVHIPND